jgi:hypothetical protein
MAMPVVKELDLIELGTIKSTTQDGNVLITEVFPVKMS